MLLRCNIARALNAAMGTTRFDAWNLSAIPSDDLMEIQLSLRWLDELRSE